ncbi:putative Cupin type-2 domain-containing protein [Seiridium unicorne]|uniref:Cupin type-2 domain-containing protein n=1 Tax=Seiridium unicorne TaxID=138068 RepID=A0ABR2UEW6_9PEZI
MAPISVNKTLQSFEETWSPRLIASVNDQHVKVAKIDGPFIFHAHPDTDELFYILAGSVSMEIEGSATVELQAGDVCTVAKGVRHRPVARKADIMMIEKAGTVNTGDEPASEKTRQVSDVRSSTPP